MKWIKRLGLGLGFLIVLLLGLVISLPFLIDPNDFKPQLQQLAAEQGYDLQLQGPISWQFFPTLGLSLEQVRVTPLTANTNSDALLAFQEASVAVAVKPLFSRQVKVTTVSIDGANIHVEIDAQGKGNWETQNAAADTTASAANPGATTASDAAATPPTDASTSAPLQIAVDSISFSNANLSYVDHSTQQNASIRDLNLSLRDVTLGGNFFPLELALQVQHSSLPTPLNVELSGQFQWNDSNAEQPAFAFRDGRFSVAAANQTGVNLATTFNVQGKLNTASDIAANVETLSVQGDIDVAQFNPTRWLSTLQQEVPKFSDNSVLQAVAFSGNFEFATSSNAQNIALNNLNLKLDQTTLTAQINAQVPSGNAVPTVNVNAQLDQFNVDRYLPPSAETATAPTSTTPAQDSPLPLEPLRALNADIALQIGQLVANKAKLTDTVLKLSGKNGLWNLSELSTRVYEGQMNAKANADARGNELVFDMTAQLQQMNVHSLLSEQADFQDLSGLVRANVSAKTRAATSNQLMANADANVDFTSDELVLAGMNAEQYFCDVVTQVQQTTSALSSWPNTTTVRGVTGQATFKNSQLNLANFQAHMGAIGVRTLGGFNLDTQAFSVRMPMKFETTPRKNADGTTTDVVATSASGCTIESNFLMDRELDFLHCNGTLDNIAFGKKCGVDRGALADILKQALRYNTQKQLEKSGVNQKVDEEKQKLQEKKQENREKAKNKLQDLLGGSEEKPEAATESTAAAEAPETSNASDESPSTKETLRNLFKKDK